MNKLLIWVNEKNFISVHSFTLYFTLWITYEAYRWAGDFALQTTKEGAEVALIIGAVTAPISLLQNSVFAIYSKYRDKEK